MAITFPSSPALNQQYTYGNRTWSWNGVAWQSVGTAQGLQGTQGLQGSQGTQGVQGLQGIQGSSYTGPTLGQTYLASAQTISGIQGLTLQNTTLQGTLVANGTVGTSGYLLTSTGTGVQWAPAPVSLPSQTGNSLQFLTTNGSTASWTSNLQSVNLINANIGTPTPTIYSVGIASSILLSSTDGITWTGSAIPGISSGSNFCYLENMNGKIAAIGTPSNGVSSTYGIIYSSDYGNTWTKPTLPVSDQWRGGGYINGYYVVVGLTNAVYSTDLVNWNTFSLANLGGASNYWTQVSVVNGTLYAIRGTSGYYTNDGINWSLITTLPFTYNAFFKYLNGKYWVSSNSGLSYSTDLVNWTSVTLPEAGAWTNLGYGNGVYVSIAGNGTTNGAYSTDGVTWNSSTLPTGNSYSDIQYFNGKFVALASGNTTNGVYSTDGIHWTAFSRGYGSQGFYSYLQLSSESYSPLSYNFVASAATTGIAGTPSTPRPTLTFIGATLSDDSANNQTTVTITSGGNAEINSIMGVY